VLIRGGISFPELPKEAADVRSKARLATLRADAVRRLNAAKPEAFKPPLGQFDAICKTLKLP